MPSTSNTSPHTFSQRIIKWYQRHGRKNLPWQMQRTPYSVWISEIMLQQTQVATVIPYFRRFMEKFPDIETLAGASVDDVLALWTGLGYYSRARNLHCAALQVVNEFSGEFPKTIDELQQLPGVGRSTAGAIRALGHGLAATILDGNVKRVLTRYHAISGWPGKPAVARELWSVAEIHTPNKNAIAYTQGMMDLGATLCTRSSPRCEECPLQSNCEAFHLNRQNEFPEKKPKTVKPCKSTTLIMLCHQNVILLEQRPSKGIWGGLWSFPEYYGEENDINDWCQEEFAIRSKHLETWPGFRHSFTHYHLDITPVKIELARKPRRCMDQSAKVWYDLEHALALGLPAPIKLLLTQLG